MDGMPRGCESLWRCGWDGDETWLGSWKEEDGREREESEDCGRGWRSRDGGRWRESLSAVRLGRGTAMSAPDGPGVGGGGCRFPEV